MTALLHDDPGRLKILLAAMSLFALPVRLHLEFMALAALRTGQTALAAATPVRKNW